MEALQRLSKAVWSISFLAVVTAFAISFFYNFGFLSAFGSSLDKAPLSMEDFALSCVSWFPGSIVVGVIVLVLRLWLSQRRDMVTDVSNDKYDINSEITRIHGKSPFIAFWLLIFVGGVFLIVLNFKSNSADNMYVPMFLWLWIVVALGIYVYYSRRTRYQDLMITLAVFGTIIPATAYSLGYFKFESDYFSDHDYYAISLAENNSSEGRTVHARLVRAFKDWLVVRDVRGNVSWIPLGHVQRFDLKRDLSRR